MESATEEPERAGGVPFFKKRSRAAQRNALSLKRRKEESDSESDFEDEPDAQVPKAVRDATKREHTVHKSEASKADKTSIGSQINDTNPSLSKVNEATKATDWFDEATMLGKTNGSAKSTEAGGANVDGNYAGQAGYQKYTQSKEVLNKKALAGPQKATNSNVRMVTVIDYQPDICKDYKETGYCGFGDSCKFLHDRENYKAGWELDKEWEDVQRKKKPASAKKADDSDESDSDQDEDDIPFACFICRSDYKSPVVTRCGHFFCESCALKRYKKTPTCAVCGAGTNGIFNGARKLKERLDAKRQRVEERNKEKEADPDIPGSNAPESSGSESGSG